MSHSWQRILTAAIVIAAAALVAKIVDWRISGKELASGVVTRYRVLRRMIFTVIVFVGVMSGLLVIPEVRAIAGAVLASSAVLGLVIGFASQRTIGNAVAGILIALAQPLRIGDEVEVQGARGTVEEIGLSYTWIRTRDNERLVVPNEKLASESIRNATIRSSRTLAEVTLQVPLTADLGRLLELLRPDADEVYVSDLTDKATFVLRKWVSDESKREAAASDLRVVVAERLKSAGVVGG